MTTTCELLIAIFNIEVTAVSSGLNMYNQSNGQNVPEYGVIMLIISAYNCDFKNSDFTIMCTLF